MAVAAEPRGPNVPLGHRAPSGCHQLETGSHHGLPLDYGHRRLKLRKPEEIPAVQDACKQKEGWEKEGKKLTEKIESLQ